MSSTFIVETFRFLKFSNEIVVEICDYLHARNLKKFVLIIKKTRRCSENALRRYRNFKRQYFVIVNKYFDFEYFVKQTINMFHHSIHVFYIEIFKINF